MARPFPFAVNDEVTLRCRVIGIRQTMSQPLLVVEVIPHCERAEGQPFSLLVHPSQVELYIPEFKGSDDEDTLPRKWS